MLNRTPFLQKTEASHLKYVFTLLWISSSLCPLFHSLPWCLSHLCLLPTLCSAALLLCSSLPWCGLSYIMHVKQTDMSESLKCMAVPLLLLHPPRVGRVGWVTSQRTPVCSPGPAELQASASNTACAFYRGKSMLVQHLSLFIQRCIIT